MGANCVCNGVPSRQADIMAVRLQNSNRRNDAANIVIHSDLLDFLPTIAIPRLYNERVYRLHRY